MKTRICDKCGKMGAFPVRDLRVYTDGTRQKYLKTLSRKFDLCKECMNKED